MQRKKMNFSDIVELESNYHAFGIAAYKGVKGEYFRFAKLTEKDRNVVNSFKNTVIFENSLIQAPELKNVTVFVGSENF